MTDVTKLSIRVFYLTTSYTPISNHVFVTCKRKFFHNKIKSCRPMFHTHDTLAISTATVDFMEPRLLIAIDTPSSSVT